MPRHTEGISVTVTLSPEEGFGELEELEQTVLRSYTQSAQHSSAASRHPDLTVRITRRSIDARHQPKVIVQATIYEGPPPPLSPPFSSRVQPLRKDAPVIIVGSGPAGYFAALELLEHGIKPIVLERGLDARSRRKDLKAIQQRGVVNIHSNYCFGEGGAGTYSDGKLYTRSDKRGNVAKILQLLVEYGAHPEILIDAHPHIGSNKLPNVVASIRQSIIGHGGEVHFSKHVCNLLIEKQKLRGVVCADGSQFLGQAVILATGHSARDVFELLHELQIAIEAKPFALGVRAEHVQGFIDTNQYHCQRRSPYLPAASYALTAQVDRNGVYSFCMCPGGLIVPAATAPGEIVVNGMSMSKRNSRFANSGVVTNVGEPEWRDFTERGPLAGLEFQRQIEQQMFRAGGGVTQCAPAQRLNDFVHQKLSRDLPECSYIPGIISQPLHELLPAEIARRLREGFILFDKKLSGYVSNDAVVVATESRTSSPVRIPRDKTTCQHPTLAGLFPCGEGAGYAGGIISAALDGVRVAQAVANTTKD